MPRYTGPRYYNPAQRRAYLQMLTTLDVEVDPHCGYCGPDWRAACWGTVAILCMSKPGEWAYVSAAIARAAISGTAISEAVS